MAEAIDDGGSKFVDVGDPDSGSMYRFYEIEFSLACGMDGERDIPKIIQWAKEELGLMPTAHEVRTVIARLGELGYLDQAEAAREAATAHPPAAAAAAAHDDELAAGVIVGTRPTSSSGVDLELGAPGSTGPVSAPLPKGAEFDLGAPGAAPSAKPPRIPVEDVALGAPGATVAKAGSEVSIDLADHMGVRPDDVKEAVRQSKVMSAVEVPQDVLDQLEPPKPVAKPVEAAKPVETAKPVEKAKPVEAEKAKPVEAAKPAEKAKPVEAAKPAEKAKPVVAEKKPIAPPAPKAGVSPVLIILLVVAIGGAGAYFAWRYLIRAKAEPTAVAPPPITPQPPVTPPVPKVVEPTAKITISPGESRDILSVFVGPIESIDTTERDVESNDVIARLAGAKRLEAELASLDKDVEARMKTHQAALANRDKATEAAAADNTPANANAVTAANANVDKTLKALTDKQDARVAKEDALERLYVRSPAFEGHLTVFAKQGQKVEENTLVAKIIPKAAPTALFKLEKNMTLERGLAVPIKVGEKLFTCTIADSTVDGTRVVCDDDPLLVEGAEATLKIEQ